MKYLILNHERGEFEIVNDEEKAILEVQELMEGHEPVKAGDISVLLFDEKQVLNVIQRVFLEKTR